MLKKLIQRPGAITEALSLLPDRMASDEAIVMLLAIGLQESRFQHRRQLVGEVGRLNLELIAAQQRIRELEQQLADEGVA